MQSLNLSPNETIFYDYNPEADELHIRLEAGSAPTREEPIEELPHLSISRDAATGAVVGLHVSSVQQRILQNLARDLFGQARAYIEAAAATAPIALLPAPEAIEEPASEAVAAEAEAAVEPVAEMPTEESPLALAEPTLEVEPPAPSRRSRSRRGRAAEVAAPEAVEPTPEAAEAQPEVAMETVEAAVEVPPARPARSRRRKADAPAPEPSEAQADVPQASLDVVAAPDEPPAEPAPAKRSRRRTKKTEEPEPATLEAEAAPVAEAETPAEESTLAVAEPEPAARPRRSRRRKTEEPAPEVPEAVADSVGEATTTEIVADAPVEEADEAASYEGEEEPATDAQAAPARSGRRRRRRRGKGIITPDTEAELAAETVAPEEASEAIATAEPEADGEAAQPAKRKRRRKRRRGGAREEQAGETTAPAVAASTPAAPVVVARPPQRDEEEAGEDEGPRRSYKTAPIPGLEAPEGFTFLGMDPLIGQAITAMGFEEPTPIQRRAIPEAMAGKDVIGLAQTGTGKTAAFLIPALQRLINDPNKEHRPRVLVLTPTRELAVQVAEEAEYLATHTDIRISTIYGGVNLPRQTDELRRGTDIIVATPGRLLDHLNRRNVNLGTVQVLVLDEADRMLDMGFLPEIRTILSRLPKERQTFLFSATMPPAIQSLSMDFQSEPAVIEVARQLPPTTIRQVLYLVDRHLKTALLLHLFERDASMNSVLVFTETKSDAEVLRRKLQESGVSVSAMHGDRSQREREQALGDLRKGAIRVLVATDVAARGLDISDISHVVNYDMPQSVDDYVHRIGRTGRGDAEGAAYTFVSLADQGMVMRIESALGRTLPRERAEEFNYDVPTPSWAKPSADDIIDSLNKPTGIADRFRRMMGGRR